MDEYIEVDCPKCGHIELHIVHDHEHTYECTVCQTEQDQKEALTREESGW